MMGAGRRAFSLAGSAHLFIVGCTAVPIAPVTSPSLPVVAYVADDYSFNGPDTLPAGVATLRMRNRGQEPHHIQLLKLEEGKSLHDVTAALADAPGVIPRWATQMGGPNAVSAGGVSEAHVSLAPGIYAMICLVPSHEGVAHAALGMTKAIHVIPNPAPAHRTSSDYHLAMREFEIVVVETVKKGTHTFQVRNRGTQAHQVSLVKLGPGSSAMDVAAAFNPLSSGPIPGELAGGMTSLEPGGEGTFTATLSEGHYALMCLFPNPASPTGHAAKGMVMNFTVE